MSQSHQLHAGQTLTGDSNKDYLLVAPLGQPNVWTAVDSETQSSVFIIKQPASDDSAAASWPNFQQEMVMQELFKDDPAIRQKVDQIPPSKYGEPPRIVLEILEGTVWDARAKRPLSVREIKSIMRDTLEGLVCVHEKGLVYADLKMENILVSGFNPLSEDKDGDTLVTKLGDLGIVMPPTQGVVQPLTYRAPEVYFKHSITPAADIWSWGLLVCHLLEARSNMPAPVLVSAPANTHLAPPPSNAPPSLQTSNSTDSATSISNPPTPSPNGTNFTDRGLYDDLYSGHGLRSQQEQSIRYALANDYDLTSIPYYADCTLPARDREHPTGRQWHFLKEKGVQEDDVAFLKWVMDPDPTSRPTAQEVLESAWLKESEKEVVKEKGDVETVKNEEEAETSKSHKRRLSTYLDYGVGAVRRAVGVERG
ncbi:kinase-like protein [Lophium mytilinum]|uniref:Kinase-like protein n=1 Tax=Lophium mytilinum TaxID=390894 RepID=A0A6A6QM78_9PEZI|nr:kinase-like protein [Lophium mytilinum]